MIVDTGDDIRNSKISWAVNSSAGDGMTRKMQQPLDIPFPKLQGRDDFIIGACNKLARRGSIAGLTAKTRSQLEFGWSSRSW